MPGRQQASVRELIRRRRHGGFVGRHGELAAFRANLTTAPDDDRHRFLFHVHGAAGVGKSSLLRQWEGGAREQGALTASLDENVTGLPEAMAALSAQFARQGRPLKTFDKLMATYRERRHEAESASGESGSPSLGGVAAAQAGLAGLGLVPGLGPVAGAVDPVRLAQGADRLRAALSARFRNEHDVRLVLSPVDVLTPVLVADLAATAEEVPWVVLLFDTYERTGPLFDHWLRDLLTTDRYGDLPATTVIALAGQGALDPGCWADCADIVQEVGLDLFTETEARQLLAAKGITQEAVVETVLRLSGRLPVLVSTLAEAHPAAPEAVDDPSDTAVERFLKWVDAPERRETALAAALPRRLDEDVFRAAVAVPPPQAPALYDWLRTLPFVDERAGRAGYHDVVRTAMLRIQRRRSPHRWREQHGALAAAFRGWREHLLPEAELDGRAEWDDERWAGCLLEETYHLLCADPRRALPGALLRTVRACAGGPDTVRSWARMLLAAGADCDAETLRALGRTLTDALADGTAGDGAGHGGGEVARQEGAVRRALTALLDGGALAGPARAAAYYQRGRELVAANEPSAALADLDRAIGLGLDTYAVHERRGLTLWNQQRLDDAVAAFGTALERDPQGLPARLMRGTCHALAGRPGPADEDLGVVLGRDPDNLEALGIRAGVRDMLGRPDDAADDLVRCLELFGADDERRAQYSFILAGLYLTGNRFEDAVRAFGPALYPGSPYAPDVYSGRATALFQLGRLEEALADYDRALEYHPDQTWLLTARAMTRRMLGRHDEALADADRAALLPAAPGVPYDAGAGAARERAGALLAMGRWAQALAALADLLALAPAETYAYGLRATAHLQLGRPRAASAELDRWLEREPERQGVRVARAGLRSLLVPGQSGEDAAVRIAPDAEADGAAREEAAEGDDAEDVDGASVLADLDAVDPAVAGVPAMRIAVCRRAGRHEQARTEAYRAADLAPGDPAVALEVLLVAARDDPGAAGRDAWLRCEAAVADLAPPPGREVRGALTVLRVLVRCALREWPQADAHFDTLLGEDPSWVALRLLELDIGYLALCPGPDAARLTAYRDRARAARLALEGADAGRDGAASAR